MSRRFCAVLLGPCLAILSFLAPPVMAQNGCEEPAPTPETQGFWHRVCLGIPANEGGIDPGRSGRGPTKSKTGDDAGLLECVDGHLGATTDPDQDLACAEMDADPPSDPCERARKQRSAVLFNVCDDRIGDPCLDLLAHGCTSRSVGEFINELNILIAEGTAESCKQAEACAADLNEGLGVVSNCPCDDGGLCATNPCADGTEGAGPGCNQPSTCAALGLVCCAFPAGQCACVDDEALCVGNILQGEVCGPPE